MIIEARSVKRFFTVEDELRSTRRECRRPSSLRIPRRRGARDSVQANLNTESFPTVNFVKSDGSVIRCDSEARSAEDFANFEKSFEKSTA